MSQDKIDEDFMRELVQEVGIKTAGEFERPDVKIPDQVEDAIDEHYLGWMRERSEDDVVKEAGLVDDLDWTVPRDIPPILYEMVSAMEGDNGGLDDAGPYYSPLP